jgi:hypothetical protein
MACVHFQGLVPQQLLKNPTRDFTLSFLPKQTQCNMSKYRDIELNYKNK